MKSGKTVSIVQARVGSSRFPSKTLADLDGTPLLIRVLDRIARASCVDEIVVATTREPADDELAAIAARAGYGVHRGSTDDVLDRYLGAARDHDAQIVIRNTADEPFVDPALIDECHTVFLSSSADYVANNVDAVYPEGIDTEVVAIDALERAGREATIASDREHVTPYIWRQPSLFRIRAAGGEPIHPEWRLTVDYPKDLDFARAVYAELPANFVLGDIVTLLEGRPDLLALCPPVPRREGYAKSVSVDAPHDGGVHGA